MPRTSKKGKKSSSASSKAAASSSSGANGDSSSVGTGQNEGVVNQDEAGEKAASASPSEQTRIMGVRMSGVKHSGLLAKNGKGR